ncbi:MAG: PD-(D/E)XK nuclease family protein [Lachnospiraceae bacterium]|nr:PD-(D/E)XK nuclease family protein [Lachnospiraceae bacterium]
MSLQLVLGNSGSGKSYYLQEFVIREAMANPKKEYLYIVPEQFTLQKQKDIVNAHPGKVIMNIDVCSFNRLAHRIFEELGIKEQVILEDTGKSMVLRKIIEENKKELQVFHSCVHRDGFVEEIKSLISEFCQYNVSVEQLEGFAVKSKLGINFDVKFGELITLYKLFREFLKGRYITSEELLDILAANAYKSRILKECIIVLDEYTGFTPVQNNLILQLVKVCERMLVSVTVDSKQIDNIEDISGQTLFRMSSRMIKCLKSIAKEAGVPVIEPIIIDSMGRFKGNTQLKHLEENIFRYPFKEYVMDDVVREDKIVINYARDISMECEFVVDKIKKYVSNNGYRYRDFAILCGEMSEYGRVLSRILEREGIAYFYDIKKHILNNPFVEMISAIFDIACSDFSYESVFRYLRCGMSDISASECDILDNYIYATGISGYRYWNRKFVRKCNRPYALDLAVVNEIRRKVLEEVGGIVKGLTTLKDCKSITKALYDFIVERCCEDRLNELSDRFEAEGKVLLAKEYIQVYPAVMNLFDKVMELIPDSPMDVLEYSKIFETGMKEIKVGLIPLSIDQVFIGDIERTRISNAKVVFLVGVNEGVIPKNISVGGIISEVEREVMISSGIELANAKSEAVFDQQFYIYLALTKASEKLYLTYSGMGNDGKPRRQSFLVNRIKCLFPGLETNVIIPDRLTWKKDALDYLIDGLKEGENEEMDCSWYEVLKWNISRNESKERLDKLLDIIFNKKDKTISPKMARKIFEKNTYSVSKIQSYCSCEYSYFLKYGLDIKPKSQAEFSVVDMGVIYHDALNRYCVTLTEKGIGFHEISEDFASKIVDESVDNAINQIMDEEMLENEVNKFVVARIKKLILATVLNLGRTVKKNGFIPKDFEVGFKVRHKELEIEGKIDRVDFLSDDDVKYYAITDYKSGIKKFDPTLFGNGIDIQLIVYCVAARSIYNDEYVPAGVYYSRLDRPVINYDPKYFEAKDGEMVIKREVLDEAIDKATKQYGLDCTVDDIEGDDKVSERKKMGRGQLKALEKYALDIAFGTHESIMDGNIKINPYRYGMEQNACEWCEYSSICGFDGNVDRYRKLKKYTMAELTQEYME